MAGLKVAGGVIDPTCFACKEKVFGEGGKN